MTASRCRDRRMDEICGAGLTIKLELGSLSPRTLQVVVTDLEIRTHSST